MNNSQRRVGILILLTLIWASHLVSAQDSTTITVVGSNLVAPVFEALKTASGVSTAITSNVTGTRSGLEALCQGQADVVTANRAISADESKNCVNNNVNYTELLIAHNILAFIVPPDTTYAQCLTSDNLNAIFPPSATGKTMNWNQVAAGSADAPLTAVVPASDQATFAALDQFIEGDGVRTDATSEGSDTDVVNLVSKTSGSIGVVSLPVATSAGNSVQVVQLNTNSPAGCVSPSAENVEQLTYPAASDWFIYVNRASLNKPGLSDLLNFAVSDQAPAVIESLGLTPPGTAIYDTNRQALAGQGSLHPFSEASTSFSIPPDVTGDVAIEGAPVAFDYLTALKTSLTSLYSTLTPQIKAQGQVAGLRRLCNGEIDIAVVDSPLTAEQSQNCDANNIKTLSIDLGKQAVVLVANASSSYLACLTTDQIKTIWSAPSADPITNWNKVDASFPDQAMTLFSHTLGDPYADLMIDKAAGTDLPMRSDTVTNDDPLYRAAATANVEGGLTYMSWADYQKVLANNQARIQLVSVNNGSSCVSPTVDTIKDGSYPLTLSSQLLVNKASLTKVQVQSFLWYVASDDNYTQLDTAGFIGVGFGDLPALRDTLQKAYVDAAVAATQPEATPEATVEATTEATAEATVEATPAASTDATAEATPEVSNHLPLVADSSCAAPLDNASGVLLFLV